MDGVVQQDAALVEQASAATQALATQADALLRKVARFRLGAGREEGEPAEAAEPAAAEAAALQLTYV